MNSKPAKSPLALFTEEQIIETIKHCEGHVGIILKHLPGSPKTFRLYLKKHPRVKKVIDELRSEAYANKVTRLKEKGLKS